MGVCADECCGLLTKEIKKSKFFKGCALIEDEKQVYCRIFLHDFNSDQEAEEAATLIADLLRKHFENKE